MKKMEPMLACCEAPNIDSQCDWSTGNEYNDEAHHNQHRDHGSHHVHEVVPWPLVEPLSAEEYKAKVYEDRVSVQPVNIVVFASACEIWDKTFMKSWNTILSSQELST